jgi:hypothetical protein
MSVRVVGLFLLALVVSVGGVLLLMAALFNHFAVREARRDVAPSPLAQAREAPPEPRLQVHPREEFKAVKAAEDATLNSYGWVDQKTGIVRIPIDRAVDLLAEKGLPARGGKADAK